MDTTETVEKDKVIRILEDLRCRLAFDHWDVAFRNALFDAISLIEAGEKDKARLDWLLQNCKIIHWPGGGHYPIEHAPACNKDGRGLLEMARNKQGVYSQPLASSAIAAQQEGRE